jgi:hypothetical protein
VPTHGTMARTVYDVLVAAEQCEETFKSAVLARLLGTTVNTVQATAWRIRRSAKSARRSRPAQVKIRWTHSSAPHMGETAEAPFPRQEGVCVHS